MRRGGPRRERLLDPEHERPRQSATLAKHDEQHDAAPPRPLGRLLLHRARRSDLRQHERREGVAPDRRKVPGARQIEQVTRVEELAPLLKDVVAASRAMAEEASNSREQLKTLQDKVLTTEAELIQLHVELDNASNLARHDPLTDVLNRKGLDEALEREIAAVRRRDTPLSVSLLDIDNFKKLNDSLGHQAGDNALIHLTKVARACMRPSDTLARYGGEEFVILMPDTQLEQGIEAMARLQRELTKAFFMSGKEKVLITFSAGVAQLTADETGSEAIRRADQAMYLAKRTGKNRVLGA